MKGTSIRNIIVILKLFTIFTVFMFISKSFCETPKEFFWYNFATLAMAIITFIYCYYSNYIDFRNNKTNKKIIKKVKKLKMKKSLGFPVYYLNTRYKNYLFNLLDKISDKQKEAFKNKGYIIIIGTTEQLSNITKIKRITGLFSHYEKYILLYVDEDTSKEQFESTFYHEWGHFVDYYAYYLSNTYKFKKFYNEEKYRFNYSIRFLYSNNLVHYLRHNPHVNMYELQNTSEYFAVNYSKYKREVLNNKYLIDIYKETEKL